MMEAFEKKTRPVAAVKFEGAGGGPIQKWDLKETVERCGNI